LYQPVVRYRHRLVADDIALEDRSMAVVAGLGLLALVMVTAILLGSEDPERSTDPRDSLSLWTRYGHR
jgi:hypothetical protein